MSNRATRIVVLTTLVCAAPMWACTEDSDEGDTKGQAPDPEPEKQEAEPEAEPEPTVERHVATFSDDKLRMCTDILVWGDIPKEKREKLMEPLSSHDEVSEVDLDEPCSEAFPDRVAVATCTRRGEKKEEGTRILYRTSYMSVAFVEGSDSFMQDCLETGGEWDEVPKGSAEYRKAKVQGQ